MLKTNLQYLSAEYGAENYNEFKQKLQQQFAAKPEKVEVRYKAVHGWDDARYKSIK